MKDLQVYEKLHQMLEAAETDKARGALSSAMQQLADLGQEEDVLSIIKEGMTFVDFVKVLRSHSGSSLRMAFAQAEMLLNNPLICQRISQVPPPFASKGITLTMQEVES